MVVKLSTANDNCTGLPIQAELIETALACIQHYVMYTFILCGSRKFGERQKDGHGHGFMKAKQLFDTKVCFYSFNTNRGILEHIFIMLGEKLVKTKTVKTEFCIHIIVDVGTFIYCSFSFLHLILEQLPKNKWWGGGCFSCPVGVM